MRQDLHKHPYDKHKAHLASGILSAFELGDIAQCSRNSSLQLKPLLSGSLAPFMGSQTALRHPLRNMIPGRNLILIKIR